MKGRIFLGSMFPTEVIDRLREEAARRDQSMAAVIRRAVLEHLDRTTNQDSGDDAEPRREHH